MSNASPNATPDIPDRDRRRLGGRGEDAVAAHYEAAGCRILERNWRCRFGELDLVVEAPGPTTVFCEVKTRSSTRFGSPLEAVTVAKQRRVRRLAAAWLSGRTTSRTRSAAVRFDVASVLVGPAGDLQVEVVEAAF